MTKARQGVYLVQTMQSGATNSKLTALLSNDTVAANITIQRCQLAVCWHCRKAELQGGTPYQPAFVLCCERPAR